MRLVHVGRDPTRAIRDDDAAMRPLIEAEAPSRWQDLEARVAQILEECGYEVEVQKEVPLARGVANIDVYAVDHTSPPNIFAFECKHWKTPATKTVVHAFRTVVGDSGANTGFIVSSAGFQKGAIDAAAYSNVRLLDWTEIQEMFVERWFMQYMAPRLEEEGDPLHEYTEPINTRIFRKADVLPPERREEFKALREKYLLLGASNILFVPVALNVLLPEGVSPVPDLPLRESESRPNGKELVGHLPDDVLDATALRPLMNTLIAQYRNAIAEFDRVFGERA